MAGAVAAPDDVGRMEVAQHQARIRVPSSRSSSAFQTAGDSRRASASLAGPSGHRRHIPVDQQVDFDHHRVAVEGRHVVESRPARLAIRCGHVLPCIVGQQFGRRRVALGHRLAVRVEETLRSRDARSAGSPGRDPAAWISGTRTPPACSSAVDGDEGRRPTAPYGRSRHRACRRAPAARAPAAASSSARAAAWPASDTIS